MVKSSFHFFLGSTPFFCKVNGDFVLHFLEVLYVIGPLLFFLWYKMIPPAPQFVILFYFVNSVSFQEKAFFFKKKKLWNLIFLTSKLNLLSLVTFQF